MTACAYSVTRWNIDNKTSIVVFNKPMSIAQVNKQRKPPKKHWQAK